MIALLLSLSAFADDAPASAPTADAPRATTDAPATADAPPATTDAPATSPPTADAPPADAGLLPPPEELPPRRMAVALQLASLHVGDPHWNVFSDGDTMPSIGARVGWHATERVEIVASWQHVARGSRIELVDSSELAAAFSGDEIGAGVRLHQPFAQVLSAFLDVQAMAFDGRVRLDDDPNDEGSPAQIADSAIAPGATAMLGLEARIPSGTPLDLTFDLGAGYGWVGRMDFGTIGDVQPGGFLIRGGAGIRF